MLNVWCLRKSEMIEIFLCFCLLNRSPIYKYKPRPLMLNFIIGLPTTLRVLLPGIWNLVFSTRNTNKETIISAVVILNNHIDRKNFTEFKVEESFHLSSVTSIVVRPGLAHRGDLATHLLFYMNVGTFEFFYIDRPNGI